MYSNKGVIKSTTKDAVVLLEFTGSDLETTKFLESFSTEQLLDICKCLEIETEHTDKAKLTDVIVQGTKKLREH